MLNFLKLLLNPKSIFKHRGDIPCKPVGSQSKKLADLKSINSILIDLKTEKDKVNRHFMLMEVVALTYKHREDAALRDLCLKTAKKHLAEMPKIKPYLEEEMGGYLPQIPTFKYYSRVLEENGAYEEALNVCNMAIAYGISDGTKSGYQGSVNSIKKRMAKA